MLHISSDQLRFAIGDTYAFSEEAVGWARRSGTAFSLELPQEGIPLSTGLLEFASHALTPWQRTVQRALHWLERALLADENLERLLFGFFAIEAVLGDAADGLKGDVLAVRRMVLDHAVTDGFADPGRLWFLYDAVRSTAVHGEAVPIVTEGEVERFLGDIAQALDQAVQFSGAITKKAALHRKLDGDDSVPDLIAWMRANCGSDWEPHLASFETRHRHLTT